MPTVLAAAAVLAQLRDEVTERAEVERAARVKAFLSKLPPTGWARTFARGSESYRRLFIADARRVARSSAAIT